MVIEFLGMVGAGKTTVAHNLQALLEERGYKVLSREEAIFVCLKRSGVGQMVQKLVPTAVWRKPILRAYYTVGPRLWHQLHFAFKHPKLTWQIYQSQLHRDIPWWHRRVILNLFFRMMGTYFYIRGRLQPDEVVLLEEGFLHRAVNLYAWETGQLDKEHLWSYFSAVPILDLVIFVQVPIQTCLERTKKRGHPSRVEYQDPAVVARFMEQAAQIIEVASDYLSNNKRDMIVVDNSDSIDASMASLRQGLEAHLAHLNKPAEKVMTF